MICPLDPEERYLLSQLCNGPWVWNSSHDTDVSLRLEQRGLAQLSLLGQLFPTPAGRLMASLM